MIRSVWVAVIGLGWSLALTLGTCGLGQEMAASTTAETGPPVLYLHTEYLPYATNVEKGITYRLGREIIRQAILLAAREELGLAAYDETLQESVPNNVRIIHLMPMERADLNGKWNVKLISYDGRGVLWEKTFDYVANGELMYADVIPKLEADTRGAFLEGLTAARCTAQKSQRRRPEPPDKEIEQLLRRVDFVSQFGAVRAAHQVIATHGETPEWLGVLVRGYANLAMLTQHHWNSATEVFTARAWLYAQRLVAADPDRELSLWHRAYAWAWGGAQQHALADLQAIEELHQKQQAAGKGEDVRNSSPAWTQLIRPVCNWDRDAIRRIGTEHDSLLPWTTQLVFQIARCYGQPRWMYDAAHEVRKHCPNSYGVYDDLIGLGFGQLALSRSGAAWGPPAFAQGVPQSLVELPDVPTSVRRRVGHNGADRSAIEGFFDRLTDVPDSEGLFAGLPVTLAQQLRRESEQTAEMGISWSALASLLEEEQFVQAALHFIDAKNATEHSLAEDADAALRVVRNHRYAPYIDVFHYDFSQDVAKVYQVLGTIKIVDPRMNMYTMLSFLSTTKDASGETIGARTMVNAQRNFTVPGLLEYIHYYKAVPQLSFGGFDTVLIDELKAIAPHSDLAAYFQLRWADNPTLEQLKQWESQLKISPWGYYYLAQHYQKLGHIDEAIKSCEKGQAITSNISTTFLLSKLYDQTGQTEQWEKCLRDYLKVPDLGLEHGAIHNLLAGGYMKRGMWQKAKPHAITNAQNWSAWGLYCASQACEGLAEWEESEKWIRDMARSYPSSSASWWYFWCRRTGRGDLDSARALAAQYILSPRASTIDREVILGSYHLLEGNTQKAFEAYRRALNLRQNFTYSCIVAQLARELHDEDVRTEVLESMQKVGLEKLAQPEPEDRDGTMAGLASSSC